MADSMANKACNLTFGILWKNGGGVEEICNLPKFFIHLTSLMISINMPRQVAKPHEHAFISIPWDCPHVAQTFLRALTFIKIGRMGW
jgi:hypothetical protein